MHPHDKKNYKKHLERHKLLHHYLDELTADYLTHTKKGLRDTTILELMNWSHSQTISPANKG